MQRVKTTIERAQGEHYGEESGGAAKQFNKLGALCLPTMRAALSRRRPLFSNVIRKFSPGLPVQIQKLCKINSD
jgi:hypothetical protein